ncbi:MAG: hypothetical protein KDA25_08230 [Phycisphaerales bacterium]|nr:hypothetical protein [Phycisphaerales bacterium]
MPATLLERPAITPSGPGPTPARRRTVVIVVDGGRASATRPLIRLRPPHHVATKVSAVTIIARRLIPSTTR